MPSGFQLSPDPDAGPDADPGLSVTGEDSLVVESITGLGMAASTGLGKLVGRVGRVALVGRLGALAADTAGQTRQTFIS